MQPALRFLFSCAHGRKIAAKTEIGIGNYGHGIPYLRLEHVCTLATAL